jgi:putative oxidoreductase
VLLPGLYSRLYSLLLVRTERLAAPALRISLAAVFVWFGLLKLTGDSPVAGLVAATVPLVDPGWTVAVLGAVEIALGLALLLNRMRQLALIVLAGHLSGTFLTFFTAPNLMIHNGNPLLLTADGEFVVKNLVLISAALVLLARTIPHQGGDPQWDRNRYAQLAAGRLQERIEGRRAGRRVGG